MALSDWLTIRGSRPEPLFWGIGNRNKGGRLTTQAIYTMLRRRAKEAGLDSLSPHDFRRTFVGDLLDRGADIATVQKLAGHASVVTIARYDRRSEEAKLKAAELLHAPYQKRVLRNTEQLDQSSVASGTSVELDYNVLPVRDRQYCHSIDRRELGGVLFEIATEPPGFMPDEFVEERATT